MLQRDFGRVTVGEMTHLGGESMKKCPFCAEEIQDEAIKCKHCNEMIGESESGESAVAAKANKKKFVTTMGIFIFVVGLAILAHYYNMDPSVPIPQEASSTFSGIGINVERVNNIGLMQEKQTGITIGIIIALFGAALVFWGYSMPSPMPVSQAIVADGNTTSVEIVVPAEPTEPPMRDVERPGFFDDWNKLSAEKRFYLVLGVIAAVIVAGLITVSHYVSAAR